MHAHGHFRFGQPLAFDQGQVHSQVGLVTEGMGGELAVRSLKWAATNAFNQRLVAAAVLDQVGNRTYLEAVLGREDLQVR